MTPVGKKYQLRSRTDDTSAGSILVTTSTCYFPTLGFIQYFDLCYLAKINSFMVDLKNMFKYLAITKLVIRSII